MLDIRRILVLSIFELKKHRTKDEKKVIFLLIALGILVYVSVSLFMSLGIDGSEAFYTYYTEDDRMREILDSTGRFVMSEESTATVFIESDEEDIFVFPESTDRGKAAVASLEQAIKDYNEGIFSVYEPELAYPIRVNVINIEREGDLLEDAVRSAIDFEEDFEADESEDIGEREDEPQEEQRSENDDVTDEEEEREDEPIEDEDDQTIEQDDVSSGIEESEGEGLESEEDQRYGTIEELNPMEQFNTLIIVVILTLPLSMIALIYSNSMMSEKINKRGVFLLLAPISNYAIIIGKTIPYFLASLAVFVPVIISRTDTLRGIFYASIIAVAVITAYMAIGFLCSMLARSHKELSFMGIFMISVYSCYLLIPAFMMNFSVISLASPLTIIARIFSGDTITPQLLAFSTLPTLISAIAIFYVFSRLFNDINMFSYRNIKDKILDGLYSIVKKNRLSISLISFFTVPLVFLIQLMVIVVLLSIRNMMALYILIFVAALVEEIFKNIGAYSIIHKSRKKIGLKDLSIYAILSGTGFFLAEKALMLIMIAPFLEAYSALVFTGFVIPLILHISISFVFLYMANRMRKKDHSFTKSLMVATVIHFIINLALSLIASSGGHL